jgi:hypothetical protein
MITRIAQHQLSDLYRGFCKNPLYITISQIYESGVTDRFSSFYWFDVVGDELLSESIRRIETSALSQNPSDYFCKEFNTDFKQYLNRLVSK